jgi:hypothetical protein
LFVQLREVVLVALLVVIVAVMVLCVPVLATEHEAAFTSEAEQADLFVAF